MKSNFTLNFFLSLFTVLFVHLGLIYLDVLQVSFKMGLKLDIILLFIFSIGALIIVPGIKKNPENFASRFIVLTTVQLLTVLSVLLAVVYVKMPNYKALIFHIISVFILVMFIQSFLLIKESNKNN